MCIYRQQIFASLILTSKSSGRFSFLLFTLLVCSQFSRNQSLQCIQEKGAQASYHIIVFFLLYEKCMKLM